MRRLANVPIKRKLTLVIMLTTGIALLLACTGFILHDVIAMRRGLETDVGSLGDVVGKNVAAALVFEDTAAAQEILNSLREHPHIEYACVMKRDGAIFARYRSPAAQDLILPAEWLGNRHWYQDGHLLILRRIVLGHEPLGVLYLQSDLHALHERIGQYLTIALAVMLMSLLVALLISARLQRVVSRPILELAQVARVVTDQKDYSLRARQDSLDETGMLIGAFNQMLSQIQARDQGLHQANQQLEQRVAERTEELRRQLQERQSAEAALRESQDQLQHAQKMEAIGRLAGGVAHDFNNLLTVINGYTELLGKQVNGDGSLRRLVDEIQSAAGRAASLTRQLLAFGRKQVLQPKLLGLNSVMTSMEKMVRRVLGENIELIIKFDPSLAHVQADPGQIEQVILNLVINARDAMPSGGQLTIRTANTALASSSDLSDGTMPPGAYVLLSISDTGSGMTEEVRAHLFEPFFTTKEAGKGSGLGLATSYGIIKQSGGFIHVATELGRGTDMQLYFSAQPVRNLPEPTEPADTAMPVGRETLLVVEDEPAVRDLEVWVLRECGYEVLEASNGAEGLRVARDHSDRKIDLVISDCIMPHMNGKDMVDRLRVILPMTKVLFVSGYTDDLLADQGIFHSGAAFLQKPFTAKLFAQKVREVLDHSASGSN